MKEKMKINKNALKYYFGRIMKYAKTNDELFYKLCFYSVCTYYPNFEEFPHELQDFYIHKYALAFSNHYIKFTKNQTSVACIEQTDFIKGWKTFISDFQACGAKIGTKTVALRKLITDNPCEYGNYEDFKNKPSRFWKNYVCRKQSRQHNAFIPEITCNEKLYREELPFYYILYTIYFYGNSKNEDIEEPFATFSKNFLQYQKFGNINNILSWCISCYHEWYDYFSQNPTDHFDHKRISTYIVGIPFFLEHFGFYWHSGIKMHLNDFLEFLNEVRCKPLGEENCESLDEDNCEPFDDKLYINIPYANDFLIQHRFYTQPLISKSPFNKPRAGVQDLSLNVSYIHYQLEDFFLLNQDTLISFFAGNYSPLKEGEPKITNPKDIAQLLDIQLKEFLSSIFIYMIQPSNDLLPYVNMHLYFYKLIHSLAQMNIDDLSSKESIENCHELLYKLIATFLNHYNQLNYNDIYQEIFLFYLQKIEGLSTEKMEDLQEQIWNVFLNFFE